MSNEKTKPVLRNKFQEDDVIVVESDDSVSLGSVTQNTPYQQTRCIKDVNDTPKPIKINFLVPPKIDTKNSQVKKHRSHYVSFS